jgi:hypothetical protein
MGKCEGGSGKRDWKAVVGVWWDVLRCSILL